MDTWDEAMDRIKHSMLAEEPEAALAGGLQLLAEFGRAIDRIDNSIARVATAIESIDSKKGFDL